MTAQTLYQALVATGLPVAYSHYPEGQVPAPPFITYVHAYSRGIAADNRNWAHVATWQVELYTGATLKDEGSEAKVEAALDGLGLPWDKTEVLLAASKLRQIIYEVDLL